MPLQPLTHHEIIGLVEPFTRAGHHLDLAGSDRLARQLNFKPIVHDGTGELSGQVLSERLELANPYPDTFVLTRVASLPDGLSGRLEVEGPEPSALLAQVAAVDPWRHFRFGPGFALAWTHRIDAAMAGPASARLALTEGTARIDGQDLAMTLKMPPVKGMPAEVELSSTCDAPIDLPDDLLAVLGWDWARLDGGTPGWRSRLRLRGDGPGRSLRAESRLEAAALHLSQTLAEPPARFHDRHLRARWGMTFRRSIPMLGFFALLAGAAALPRLAIAQDSLFRLILFNAPPLLLAAGFCMHELPRFEIPPWPRRSRAPAWRSLPRRPAGDAGPVPPTLADQESAR